MVEEAYVIMGFIFDIQKRIFFLTQTLHCRNGKPLNIHTVKPFVAESHQHLKIQFSSSCLISNGKLILIRPDSLSFSISKTTKPEILLRNTLLVFTVVCYT
jgi:hypothetical protein